MGKLLEMARRYCAAVKIDPTVCQSCRGPMLREATPINHNTCSDECYTQYVLDTSL